MPKESFNLEEWEQQPVSEATLVGIDPRTTCSPEHGKVSDGVLSVCQDHPQIDLLRERVSSAMQEIICFAHLKERL